MFEYFKGAFRGTGEWVMEKVDDSHTRMVFRWRASPAGVMRLMAHLVDVPTAHSRVMQKGYQGLDHYLAASHTTS